MGTGTVTTRDGEKLFYKDWGSGPAVVFSHGWPLNADAWEDQMRCVAEHGFRGIAHDRRGHGRSTQPWEGYDFDTFADDLNDLLTALDLREVTLVAHSMGGGELARYVGRHGTERICQAVLLSAIPPLLMQTQENPEGVPAPFFEDIKNGLRNERSQFFRDTAEGFFSANRADTRATQGNKDAFWFMAMQQSIKAGLDCVTAFAETDFTEDLRQLQVRTLVVHGDDDQIVPVDATARKAVEIIPNATLSVYEGGSHGIALTPGFKDRFNQDLLDFLRG